MRLAYPGQGRLLKSCAFFFMDRLPAVSEIEDYEKRGPSPCRKTEHNGKYSG